MSVGLSQAGTVPKGLNTGSCKQCHTIAHGLQFFVTKDLGKILTGSPQMAAQTKGRVGSNLQFSNNISLYFKNGAR